MKKLIERLKSSNVAQVVLVLVLLLVAVFAGSVIIDSIGDRIAESRINKLEQEKQEALKQAQAAHDRNLVLQGEVQAKDLIIKDLYSQIADSNQRVTNAHNETVSARSNYQKVRTDAPKFNSADDAGRVDELGAVLHRLYPHSP